MGVHDLDKYPEVKALLGIPEDEPIFILRAQDVLFRPTLAAYEALYVATAKARNPEGSNMTSEQWNFADDVDETADDARQWQRTHPVKIPD
jgi:hypothetical protein